MSDLLAAERARLGLPRTARLRAARRSALRRQGFLPQPGWIAPARARPPALRSLPPDPFRSRAMRVGFGAVLEVARSSAPPCARRLRSRRCGPAAVQPSGGE